MCSTPKNNGLSIAPPKKLDENFDYASHNRMLKAASERFERRQQAREAMHTLKPARVSPATNERNAPKRSARKSAPNRVKAILIRLIDRLAGHTGYQDVQKSAK